MTKILRLFMVVLAILFLAGCATYGYRYVVKGEEAYISMRIVNAIVNSGEIRSVRFSSIEEMREDIKLGRFTEDELKVISEFNRDASAKIRVPNVDTVELSLPEVVELESVIWNSDNLWGQFVGKNGIGNGSIDMKPQEYMYEDFEKFYTNRTFNKKGKETWQRIHDANGSVPGTVYYFTNLRGKRKDVQYTVSTEDISYYVQEQYALTSFGERLECIEIWCFGGEGFFKVIIYNNDDYSSLFQLTVDEITQFRLTY